LRTWTAYKTVLKIVTNRAFFVVMHPIVHPAPNRIDPSDFLNAVMTATTCGLLSCMHVRNGGMGKDQCPQSHKHRGRPFPNALHRGAIYDVKPYLEAMTCNLKGLVARTLAFFVMSLHALVSGQSSNALHFDGVHVRGRALASGTSAFSSLTLPLHVPSGAHFLHLSADRVRQTSTLFIE
jgi:hypothetical protein